MNDPRRSDLPTSDGEQDELTLDKETIQDLEVESDTADAVKGGMPGDTKACPPS